MDNECRRENFVYHTEKFIWKVFPIEQCLHTRKRNQCVKSNIIVTSWFGPGCRRVNVHTLSLLRRLSYFVIHWKLAWNDGKYTGQTTTQTTLRDERRSKEEQVFKLFTHTHIHNTRSSVECLLKVFNTSRQRYTLLLLPFVQQQQGGFSSSSYFSLLI